MGEIAVMIPTLRRPESLDRALRSLSLQQDRERLIDKVVVVDNSPEGSAAATAQAWASALPMLYLHEPRPGVATARNTGLAWIEAPLVAFLDDDEEAPPHWLQALLAAHRQFGADVTFGPTRGLAESAPTWKRAYLEAFFSRIGPASSGPTTERHGCGNSLMTRATALAEPVPFDVACNEIGGEDDRLFTRLQARGLRFAWAAEAWVFEHAPAHRLYLAYTLRRAFSFGQSPTTDCVHAGDWPGAVKWMAIGAGQVLLYGLAACGLWLVGSRRRLAMTDRAVRGMGKVIWWVTPKFYGSAELTRTQG